ncbi:Protein patched-like protein 1 [Diplonema papillatum]|nr:Protein patched-like protein 1 [Diplonema papillatum]KAJ9456491.1 Protein patched-like protein 1 [Diplonema papillatum]
MLAARNALVGGGRYEAHCYRPVPNAPCTESTVLEVWQYDEQLLANDPNVTSTLQQWMEDNPKQGAALSLRLAGDFAFTLSADAVLMSWQYDPDDAGMSAHDDESIELMANLPLPPRVTLLAITSTSIDKEIARVVQDDVSLVAVSIVLVVVFCSILLGDLTVIGSRAILGATAAALMLLAFLFGLATLPLTQQVLTPITPLILFVLIGIGVDDVIIIVDCYAAHFFIEDRRKRIAKALSISGPSITLTTVTDIIAFAVGSAATMPAVRAFAVTALFVLAWDFVLQCSVFLIALDTDESRVEANRLDVLFCVKARNRDATIRDLVLSEGIESFGFPGCGGRAVFERRVSEARSAALPEKAVEQLPSPVDAGGGAPPKRDAWAARPGADWLERDGSGSRGEAQPGCQAAAAGAGAHPLNPLQAAAARRGSVSRKVSILDPADPPSTTLQSMSSPDDAFTSSETASRRSADSADKAPGRRWDDGGSTATDAAAVRTPPSLVLTSNMSAPPQDGDRVQTRTESTVTLLLQGRDLSPVPDVWRSSPYPRASDSLPPTPTQPTSQRDSPRSEASWRHTPLHQIDQSVSFDTLSRSMSTSQGRRSSRKRSFLLDKMISGADLVRCVDSGKLINKEQRSRLSLSGGTMSRGKSLSVCYDSLSREVDDESREGEARGGKERKSILKQSSLRDDDRLRDNAETGSAEASNFRSQRVVSFLRTVEDNASVSGGNVCLRPNSFAWEADSIASGDDELQAAGGSAIARFIQYRYAPFITHAVYKYLVVAAFLAWTAVCALHISDLESGISFAETLPRGSYVTDFMHAQEELFQGTPVPLSIILTDSSLDWASPHLQTQLADLVGTLAADESILAVDPWVLDFQSWAYARLLSPGGASSQFEERRASNLDEDPPLAEMEWRQRRAAVQASANASVQARFEEELQGLLDVYARDVDVSAATEFVACPGKPLCQVRLTGAQRVGITSEMKIRDVRAARALFGAWRARHGATGFVSASFYAYSDGDVAISGMVWNNLLLSTIAVLVALLLFMPPIMALLVTLIVCLIDVSILGWMYFLGVKLSPVSYVVIAMSIGVSVDYCAHIGIAFCTCRLNNARERPGSAPLSGAECVQKALEEIGGSILAGGLSTLFGVVVLAGASSNAFVIFFQVLFASVMFGIVFGFVFFPAFLSCMPLWLVGLIVLRPQ